MKFKIIRHIKKRVILKFILPFTFFLPAIGVVYYSNLYPDEITSFSYQITSYILFFITFLLAVYALFFMNSFKIIGFMKFDKNYIKLPDNKIPVNEIKEITIFFDSYYGEVLSKFSVKQGDKNIININTINGDKYSYYFYLGKRTELNYLKNTMNFYKKNGIKINFT